MSNKRYAIYVDVFEIPGEIGDDIEPEGPILVDLGYNSPDFEVETLGDAKSTVAVMLCAANHHIKRLSKENNHGGYENKTLSGLPSAR